MAGDAPSLSSLQKDVKAQDIIRKEQRDFDCMPCRVVGNKPCNVPSRILILTLLLGGTAFIGLGVYTYYEGQKQLALNQNQIKLKKSMLGLGPRKAGIAGISAGLVWMGIYRLFG